MHEVDIMQEEGQKEPEKLQQIQEIEDKEFSVTVNISSLMMTSCMSNPSLYVNSKS